MRLLHVAILFSALAVAVVPDHLAGQEVARNALYVELGGSGGVASMNYERRISAARLRIGAAQWSVDDLLGGGSESYLIIPLTVSSVRGSGRHHLETGGGVGFGRYSQTSSLDDTKSSDSFVTLSGIIGYRFQKPGSGFLFRAVFTPMYGLGDEDVAWPQRGFYPLAGISFGYAFR